MKKYLLASLAVFVTFFVLDILVHGMLLRGQYQATASLWRSESEMQGLMGLALLSTLIVSLAFTAIYAWLVRGNSALAGLRYGALYGLGAGFSMGLGTYAMMPIPLSLGIAWFVSFAVESAVAGAVAGAIVKADRG